MNKPNIYARPYCKDCKITWGKSCIGFIINCTKCGKPLMLRNCNPYPQMTGGVAIIILGGLTYFIPEIPVIWVGGVIGGIIMIFNAQNHWDKIQKLDETSKPF